MLLVGFYSSAQQGYWKKVVNTSLQGQANNTSQEVLFELQPNLFQRVLKEINTGQEQRLLFPDLNGAFNAFAVKETPVFHPTLSKKYPQIKSFTGISSDGTKKIRFSQSHNGLSGMMMNFETGETTFLERDKTRPNAYRIFQQTPSNITEFICTTSGRIQRSLQFGRVNLVDDRMLRRFRIAVSTTGEYTDYHGGSVADALAAINATLTRVNEVFETDLAVTLELVPNNDLVIFTNAETDPYSGSLNAQVQNTLTTAIGEENYDVGHLFHRDNDNGNAGFIGSVCVDGRKGSAFASTMTPEGDVFDLDFVAHELGHQFGANHTWSFESESTGVQAEPASGTTIMGYAGIVEGNNVALNGDDYFHHNSIAQIQEYLGSIGCSQNIALSNSPPVVVPQSDYTIPRGTAFMLAGEATDVDGDVLTYTWEQIDDGVVVTSTFGPDNTSGANFRSLPPTIESVRYFPRLSRVLSGQLEQVNPSANEAWETVSNVERELNFALTVRDNNLEGGQVSADTVKINVVNSSRPFSVTSQSAGESYAGGSVQTITWDVANTNGSPISAETVDIFLSLNGGANFPIILAENVPNNGFAEVQLPGMPTDNARIMVRASENVFFAVNSDAFIIQESQAILNFEQLSYGTCIPNTLNIPFDYEVYGGFSETMALSVNTSAPFTPSFSQNSVVNDGTSVTLTLDDIQNAPVGSYEMEVVATGQSFATSTTLTINVFESSFGDVVLTFPENLAVGTSVNPMFAWAEDDNHTAFDIEIATEDTFTNVVESAEVAFNTYQSLNLQPETNYFWRVRPKNQCGDGNFGNPFSFSTSLVNCADFDTDDQPQLILPQGTPTVTAKVFLAQDLVVSDINVNLELSHTYLEDLVVSLISPSGTRVVLISKNCGNQNNILASFDDDGMPISCSGNPAIDGVVKPIGSLSSFNGESTLGEWTLEILDTAASDGGSLDAFSLEICVEGIFRPDDDEDGVFDDGDDLCLGTPKGTLVDASGCPLNAFPNDNFSISIQSESCRENNDGALTILASDTTLDYMASLAGNGIDTSNPFNETTTFAGLSAGIYQVCITGTDGTINFREACFDIIIEEPEELGVLANLLTGGEQVRLTMSGAMLYNIDLNGLVTQTLEDEIIIDLEPGMNELRVSSGILCQGIFQAQYYVSKTSLIFPNPASELVTLILPFSDQEMSINVFTADGRLIKRVAKIFEGPSPELNVSDLANGLYYIVIEANGKSTTTKLIKE